MAKIPALCIVLFALSTPAFAFDARVEAFLSGVEEHRALLVDLSGKAAVASRWEDELLSGEYEFQMIGDLWKVKLTGQMVRDDGTIINSREVRHQTRLLRGSTELSVYNDLKTSTISERTSVKFVESLVLAGIDSIDALGRPVSTKFDFARKNPDVVRIEYLEHSSSNHQIVMTYHDGEEQYARRSINFDPLRQHSITEASSTSLLLPSDDQASFTWVEVNGVYLPQTIKIARNYNAFSGQQGLMNSLDITFSDLRANQGLKPSDLEVLVPENYMIQYTLAGKILRSLRPVSLDDIMAGRGVEDMVRGDETSILRIKYVRIRRPDR